MNFIDSARRAPLSSLSVATLMTASATLAVAQDQRIVVEQERATTYLNGGVGEDEAQYTRKPATDWSLRLTFSESKHNEWPTSGCWSRIFAAPLTCS